MCALSGSHQRTTLWDYAARNRMNNRFQKLRLPPAQLFTGAPPKVVAAGAKLTQGLE